MFGLAHFQNIHPLRSSKDYMYTTFWSERDGLYITQTNFFFTCAHGDTPEESIREAHVAVEFAIELCVRDGTQIPSPLNDCQTRLELCDSLLAAYSDLKSTLDGRPTFHSDGPIAWLFRDLEKSGLLSG